jgi:hypothetical protein
MGSSGFFKGEKKKAKKGGKETKNIFSNAPVFTLPELVSKKKKEK